MKKDNLKAIQTMNDSVVDRCMFIFADDAIFCGMGAAMGACKRGKNTCARTWRLKRGGGLFLGEYGMY